jgi:hypothetical protein
MAARRKKAASDRPELRLRGLSYADWEDEAALLRREAAAPAAQRRVAIKRVREMLDAIDDELEAMERVTETLDRADAGRLRAVRDLLIALRAGLEETRRQLLAGGPRARKKPATAE